MRRATAAFFLFSTAFLGLVFASPTFGDPDAYYHLWMAKRILAAGPVRAFPWLPFTTLAAHFADQHFLYHLALIPFIALFGDFWGLKVATVLFAALALCAFRFLLKTYGVRRPTLWTLPLLFAPEFVFRLLLTKAGALALTALCAFLIALKKEKRLAVFAIAFAYVWLHGGWPILVIVGLVDALVRRSARFLPALFGGLTLGLVVNPFFPSNLSFYWEQIVQVAVIGRSAGVVVGQEWDPTDLGSLIMGNFSVFLPLFAIAALTAHVVRRETPVGSDAVTPGRKRGVALFGALAVVFLCMTMRQARHKEYFLPLLLAFSAVIGELAFSVIDMRSLAARAKARMGRAWKPLLIGALMALVAFAGYEAVDIQRVYAGRQAWTRFTGAGAWMRAHLPPGAIVFQTAWDDTPFLLYRDDAQRYIAGLDPRFFSDKDPAKYWEWRDISDGRRRVGLSALIKKDFDAQYVFLKRDHEPLYPLMKKDPSFERVYQDEESEVWLVNASLESSQP